MAHASYCILGLALVITQSVLLFSLIKYAGAGYLVYLGVKGLFTKSGPAKTLNFERSALRQISLKAAFLEGFLCNILNPKLAVFLLSMFTQFIAPDATTSEKGMLASIFVGESALYWPLVVMLLQSKIMRDLFSRAQRVIDRTCGAMLIGLGLKVALSRE